MNEDLVNMNPLNNDKQNLNLLAIETSTHSLELGVALDGKVAGSFSIYRNQKHVEILVESIGKLLKSLSVELRELDAITVDVGPGLFTGIRTGIATTMALAKSTNLRTIPISSLEILAHQGRFLKGDLIVPIIDAKKDEVYFCPFSIIPTSSPNLLKSIAEFNANLETKGNAMSSSLSNVFDHLASIDGIGDKKVVLLGSGLNRYCEDFIKLAENENRFNAVLFADDYFEKPDVQSLLKIAQQVGLIDSVFASDLKPNYLRQANIKIGWETR